MAVDLRDHLGNRQSIKPYPGFELYKTIKNMGEVSSWDEWVKRAEEKGEEALLDMEDPNLEYYYVETRIYKKVKHE